MTTARAQRGFGGFMMIMLITALAATAGLFAFYRGDTVAAENDRANVEVLAATKAALIGYAVGKAPRPGQLPCPDTNNDGLAESSCTTAASLIGRVPWRDIGIPQPVDASGETLWYALSSPFKPAGSSPPAPTERINSDTRGNITVRAADGSTVLTNQAVAVIFAPGAAHSAQNRSAASANTASNFLDSSAGTNNAASASGPFIAGASSQTFNDRLVYLDTTELIPALELRVANTVKWLLEQYRLKSVCQCYPWADTWAYSAGEADISQNRGRLPSRPYPEDWGSGSIPDMPAWLSDNNWHNLIWYSVGRAASADPTNCRTCSSDQALTVGTAKAAALFFMPGTPLDAQPRLPQVPGWQTLSSAQRARSDNLTLYLQDSANNNKNSTSCPDTGEIGGDPGSGALTGATFCDQYVAPPSTPSTPRDRDRLYMLGAATGATCASNAQAVMSSAPCGSAWTITNPACIAALPNLDVCTCSSAARVMSRPPCTNEIHSPQCVAALAQLLTCTL